MVEKLLPLIVPQRFISFYYSIKSISSGRDGNLGPASTTRRLSQHRTKPPHSLQNNYIDAEHAEPIEIGHEGAKIHLDLREHCGFPKDPVMGIIDISLRARRARRGETAAHMYVVGQVVRMRDDTARTARSADIFRITPKLPPDDGLPQYRLKNTTERFERVATQDAIEPLALSRSAEPLSLAETAFGVIEVP